MLTDHHHVEGDGDGSNDDGDGDGDGDTEDDGDGDNDGDDNGDDDDYIMHLAFVTNLGCLRSNNVCIRVCTCSEVKITT
jgi:hypothetical protein